jgi:hypothetical protein
MLLSFQRPWESRIRLCKLVPESEGATYAVGLHVNLMVMVSASTKGTNAWKHCTFG